MVNTLHTTGQDTEAQAARVINAVVDEQAQAGSTDAAEFRREVEERTSTMTDGVRGAVSQYIDGIQPHIRNVTIKPLEKNVGGVCASGEIAIANETMKVRDSIADTIANVEEVGKHEKFHQDQNHTTESFTTLGGQNAESFVTIGGVNLTHEQYVEGLTVWATGHQFVSSEYVNHMKHVQRGAQAAGLTQQDLEEAGNDMTLIDDRSRPKNANRDKEVAISA